MKLSKGGMLGIFLAVYAFLFGLVQFLRNQISIDAMEAVLWGELLDFGTNKHPPLSGWIMGGFFNLFGENPCVAYFLGTVCIAVGLFFVYKLAKNFMSEEKAVCSAMVMTICFYNAFKLYIDSFNCNMVSIALWPAIGYFYYKSVRENKISNWILFGITSGLGFLTKYQIVFFFLALFIHLITCERKQFRQKGMYIAILTGLLVIAPHVIWLIQNDFFSFIYMTIQAGATPESTQPAIFSLKRMISPVKFLADQILAVLPCIGAYLALALQAKNINILKGNEQPLSDKVFLLSICIVPALSQGMMGLFTASYIHGVWGSIMVSFAGIILFYFFPVKFNEKSFLFFYRLMYILIGIWLVILTIFGLLQVKHNIRYPHQENTEFIHKVWAEKTNNAPLKYIGGNIDLIFQFRVYDKKHPHVILDSFGYKNPWENHQDIAASGAVILGRSAEELMPWAKNTIIYLPENYKIVPQEYEYEIKNIFGKTKKFTLYYAIIPPKMND